MFGNDDNNVEPIVANEAEEKPKPKDFKKKFKPPFFSTWTEMAIWLALPLTLFLLATAITFFLTLGYNFVSVEKRIYQYGTWVLALALFVLYVRLSYHYVTEDERIVVFQSGEAIAKKGPGHILLLPLIQNPKKVDLREKSQEIKKEPCLTRDQMLANAGFYITWQIDDPILSLTKVSNVEDSMSLLSAAILRTSIAELTMEEALERRKTLSTLIGTRIKNKAQDWGVRVNSTEIYEFLPPENIMRSIKERFNATIEKEVALAKSEAQIETLRMLMAIRPGIDDQTISLYNSLSGNSSQSSIRSEEETISDTTKEFLSRNPDYNLFHIELTLQNLISIHGFSNEIKETLQAIDFIYSILAIASNEDKKALTDITNFLQSLDSGNFSSLSTLDLNEILHRYNSPPLLISSLKYASPISIDLLGISGVIEKVIGVIKDLIWRGKYEKKIADLDIDEKTLKNQKMQIDLFIETIEKVQKLELSKKQKDLLLSAVLPKMEVISKSSINPQLLFITKEKTSKLTSVKKEAGQLSANISE